MREPVITILMPCKDPHPDYFRAAIQSVLSQTLEEWQLIIIGESNDSLQIQKLLSEYSEVSHITVIHNESKLLSGALNTGMRHANTDFVCILLGDDLLAPHAVEVLRKNIVQYSNIDFFHSSRRIIDKKGQFISSVYPSHERFELTDFIAGAPAKHLLCWKKDKALSIGGIDENLGLHGADDYDFPWCMAEAGYQFKAIPECLYYYRDHREHERLTTHVPLNAQIDELKKIFKKHKLSEDVIKKEISKRKDGYLKQALFQDEHDRTFKEEKGCDLKQGWKEKYKK